MVHKVGDLPVEARAIVEKLIGRALAENETFSIRTLRVQKDGADATAVREAANQLEKYFAEIDSQHTAVADDQAAAVIDDAMRHTRPGYTSVR